MLRIVLGRIRSLIFPSDDGLVDFVSGSPSRKRSNELSVVARDVDVVGKFLGLGALDVVGSFDGNIFADTVSIRSEGLVTGSIVANSVTVNGRVEGKIVCQNLAIGSTGFVKGSVAYSNILIEDGGMISGDCENSNVTEQQIMGLIDKELARGMSGSA